MSLEESVTLQRGGPGTGLLLREIPRLDAATWHALPPFHRWLVMVRAPVLIMTFCAAMTGVLLGLRDGHFYPDRLLALIAGLLLAHATNNLINDWVDHYQGIDRNNYFRQQYGTHVLEDALVGQGRFFRVTVVTGLLALCCGAYLVMVTGPVTGYLMAAGAFFVLFYTWPLKHLALGELSVLIVWGPLIVAGSYFLLTGTVTGGVIMLSVIAGIPPTLVILGKHMDKLSQDRCRSIRTLPVVIGLTASRRLCLALIGIQWLLIALMAQLWLLVCLLSVPALWSLVGLLRREPPTRPPADYPANVWPLWYSAGAFLYARNFGLALLAAILLSWMTA